MPKADDPPGPVARNGQTKMTPAQAKDPLRPRRKKARRACHACQRAHLTCGDERPCQRCIKRGLQDHCQDGVRKKAKYLHDAPIDTGPPPYPPPRTRKQRQQQQQQQHQQQQQEQQDQTPHAPQSTTSSQDLVSPSFNPDGTMDTSAMDTDISQDMLTSPIVTTGLSSNVPQPQNSTSLMGTGPFFDPSDPSLFAFDLSSLNFGSHYGALEFGMLGQMTGGNAATTTTTDASSQYPTSTGFAQSPQTFVFGDTGMLSDWGGRSNMAALGVASAGNINSTGGSYPQSYAIANAPGSITSPSPPAPSPRQMHHSPYEQAIQNAANSGISSPSVPQFFPGSAPGSTFPNAVSQPNQGINRSMTAPASTLLKAPNQATIVNRRAYKDSSSLYSSVTKPYPYTAGYHRLLTLLRNRFPPPSLGRIARSMAYYRPSFIACTKTLKEDDLIFMEKCFQRTLWEYEKFIGQCGTPTIVCRRTGEVAAVGKEFCHLSSWPKDVLLGIAPNKNTNLGTIQKEGTPLQSLDPRSQMAMANGDNSSAYASSDFPKPVFLAELLDQENVVEFYEQFAKLAFGDSRGAVMTKCKILKYRPKNGDGGIETRPKLTPGGGLVDTPGSKSGGIKGGPGGGALNAEFLAKNGIVGESGMETLSKDGKVECTFCWTVKRDVFDIPMLIVGNFLPILHSNPINPSN